MIAQASHGSGPPIDSLLPTVTDANLRVLAGMAAHECVSEEALVHLKSYKYSSVDKSLISKYILRHYVPSTPPFRSRLGH